MAIYVPNRGLYQILKDDASAIDVRLAVFTNAVALPAAATVRDWNFLGDVTGTEAAVTGYSRQDIADITLTEDDTNDEVTITGTGGTLTSVAAGETWLYVVWYKFNASDAAADIICVDEPAATLVTNGGNVTLPNLDLTVAQA